MPRLKLTKSAIDALPTPAKDIVYWDSGCPGFGVKITPKGRRVFIVLYRAGGAGSRLRKYTIGPFGRITLHQARAAALRIFAARTEGRDPAVEKQLARRRLVAAMAEDGEVGGDQDQVALHAGDAHIGDQAPGVRRRIFGVAVRVLQPDDALAQPHDVVGDGEQREAMIAVGLVIRRHVIFGAVGEEAEIGRASCRERV